RALGKLPSLSSSQTLQALYTNQKDFRDITKGSTGSYDIVDSNGDVVGQIPVTAKQGYDLVTGVGTPIANVLVPHLATATSFASSQAATDSQAPAGASTGRNSRH